MDFLSGNSIFSRQNNFLSKIRLYFHAKIRSIFKLNFVPYFFSWKWFSKITSWENVSKWNLSLAPRHLSFQNRCQIRYDQCFRRRMANQPHGSHNRRHPGDLQQFFQNLECHLRPFTSPSTLPFKSFPTFEIPISRTNYWRIRNGDQWKIGLSGNFSDFWRENSKFVFWWKKILLKKKYLNFCAKNKKK